MNNSSRKKGAAGPAVFSVLLLAAAAPALGGPSCVVPPAWRDAEALAPLARAMQGRSAPGTGEERALAPTGSAHLLVILAEFADKPHRVAPSRFDELLFGGAFPGLDHYYDEVSGSRLSVTGDVYGWVPLPQDQFFYSQNAAGVGSYPNNGQKMAEDAVLAAIGIAGLDLRDYDANGDDVVDALLVIHSGQGFEWAGVTGANALSTEPDPGSINSHKWVVRMRELQAGAPQVLDYFTCPELQLVRSSIAPGWPDSISTIGVYAHEFGHILGLPDYYDTETFANHVGVWDIMDYGTWNRASSQNQAPGAVPAHFSAWSKMFLGWIDPELAAPAVGEEISSPFRLDSTSGAAGGRPLQTLANKFGVDWSMGAPGTGEFFVAEVRTQDGYDAGLPSEGLLVYHVDESRPSNSGFDNPDEGRLLRLEPRDGETNVFPVSAIVGEPWPGAGESSFGPSSDPSSRLHDGTPSGVTLTDIGAVASSSVDLTACVENLQSTLPLPFARPNPWRPSTQGDVHFVVSLDSVELVGGALSIYDVHGRKVRTLPTEDFQFGDRIAAWDGRTDDGRPAVAGIYFFRLDATPLPAAAGKLMLFR